MNAGRTVKVRPVGVRTAARGRAARRVRGGEAIGRPRPRRPPQGRASVGACGLGPAVYRAYSVIVPSGLIIIASGTSSASPNDVELRIE